MAATLTQGAINSLGLSPSTPAATLTQGAIKKFFGSDDSVYSSDRLIDPVLQIIELKKRCVWLSDGTNSVVGMLAGNLFNSDVYLKKLQKYSFVKLTVYTLSTSLNRVVFIFDCDVVLYKCDVIIGEPSPLPECEYSQLKPECDLPVSGIRVSDLGFFDPAVSLGAALSGKPEIVTPGHGAIEIMCSDETSTFLSFNNRKPLLLQVYGIHTCGVCLSDGKNIIFAVTPNNLEDEFGYYELDEPSSGFNFKDESGFNFKDEFVYSAYPEIGSIVTLYNYTLKEFHGHKFIIIFDFVVLERQPRIGNPVALPTNNTSWSEVLRFLMSSPSSFSLINLTQGAIEKILDCNFSYDEGFEPVLQVLFLGKTNIVVSDGSYALNLPHQVNLIERFSFYKVSSRSVIKITEYYVNKNSENPKVVILDLKVILHKMRQIGYPTQLANQAPLSVSLAKPFNKSEPLLVSS